MFKKRTHASKRPSSIVASGALRLASKSSIAFALVVASLFERFLNATTMFASLMPE